MITPSKIQFPTKWCLLEHCINLNFAWCSSWYSVHPTSSLNEFTACNSTPPQEFMQPCLKHFPWWLLTAGQSAQVPAFLDGPSLPGRRRFNCQEWRDSSHANHKKYENDEKWSLFCVMNQTNVAELCLWFILIPLSPSRCATSSRFRAAMHMPSKAIRWWRNLSITHQRRPSMIGKTSHHTRQKWHQDRRSERSPPVSKHFQLSKSQKPTISWATDPTNLTVKGCKRAFRCVSNVWTTLRYKYNCTTHHITFTVSYVVLSCSPAQQPRWRWHQSAQLSQSRWQLRGVSLAWQRNFQATWCNTDKKHGDESATRCRSFLPTQHAIETYWNKFCWNLEKSKQ